MSKFFIDDLDRDVKKKALWKGAAPNAKDFVQIDSAPFDGQGVVTAQNGEPAADVEVGHAGPHHGEASSPGTGDKPATQGMITKDGSRVTISGEMGEEAIDIRHHNGAHVVVRPDGAIYMYSSGKKGFGMVAGKGDGTIAAKGRIILDADDLIIQSKGDIQFHSGGSMRFYSGKDFQTQVLGSMSHEVDGRYLMEVVNQIYVASGGATSHYAGGNFRIQTPETFRTDSKVGDIRTTEGLDLNAGKTLSMRSKDDADISSTDGSLTLASKQAAVLGSIEGLLTLIGKTGATMESDNTINIRGTNFINMDGARIAMDTSAAINMRTTNLNMHAQEKIETRSGGATKVSAQSFNLDTSQGIDIRGSTIDLNKATPGSPQPPDQANVVSTRTAPTVEAPAAAAYPDALTILQAMTSTALAPDFPYNAKRMSSNEMSTLENEGGEPNEKAKNMAYQNTPAGSRPSQGDRYGKVHADPSNNTSVGEESPYPPPTSSEALGEWLSKNVTTGAFRGINRIPGNGQNGASKQQIMDNIRYLCHNILDPLIDKFGSDVYISSGFRLNYDGRQSKHYIGKAVDVRAANKSDHTKTAEFAKFVIENLPFDAVWLERNNEGGIHVHFEAAPPGSKGARRIGTCADPKCKSRIDGSIELDFAVKALNKFLSQQ